MSSTIITPGNFAPNLAMYMDAAAIGRVATSLEDGRIIFDGIDSEPVKLERIIELNPRAENIDISMAVEKGNSNGVKSDISKILGEVNYIQGVADATVRRKDRKGNFRKETSLSYDWASKFFALPEEELGKGDAAEAFLESAFFYTSFRRFEDRTRAYDLFMSAAKCFTLMKKHTAAAIVCELAWEMLKGLREEALTVLKLRRMAAEAWLASVDEYVEPDSLRFRIFRGLIHSRFMSSRRVIQGLLLAIANHEFVSNNLYEAHANDIRQAYTISNHGDVKEYEWRKVNELLMSASLAWKGLESAEVDISESLMQLAMAARDFVEGRDQHLAGFRGK